MRETVINDLVSVITNNAGPFIFLALATAILFFLPDAEISKAAYMIIGAALTRVKRTDK